MRASPTTVPHIHRIEARPRGPDQPTIASVAGRSPDRARLRATGATARGGSAADAAGNAPMSEPKTIRVKDGGFVSLERGPDEKGWTRLEVATADRTVALGVILTSDEAVALGLQLRQLAGGPEPYG